MAADDSSGSAKGDNGTTEELLHKLERRRAIIEQQQQQYLQQQRRHDSEMTRMREEVTKTKADADLRTPSGLAEAAVANERAASQQRIAHVRGP